MDFQVGSTYLRREVNQALGGQVQGGICTPRGYPVVILFSDRANAYGYRDGWKDDGFFHYTGQGQVGDMRMVRGNSAILRHQEDRKLLMVFKETEKRHYRFEGYMEYVGYYEETLPDGDGNLRRAFIFKLQPVSGVTMADSQSSQTERLAMGVLRDRALAASSEKVERATRSSVYHERSRAVAAYVLERATGFCEGCGLPAPFLRKGDTPYLETHHIFRVSDEGPDKPSTVIALCPTCHRRVHYGRDGKVFNAYLARMPAAIAAIEEAYAANRLKIVTAAIVFDSKGRVLIAERGRGELTGFWEFPGGKVRDQERPEDCVVRELREELRIDLEDVVPFVKVDHDYANFSIRLLCFTCATSEAPVLTEHRAIRWVYPEQLSQINLAQADAEVAAHLLKRTGTSIDVPIAADRVRGEYPFARR